MEVIVIEKESYYKMLAEMKQAVRDAVRDVKKEILKETGTTKKDEQWILRAEAMHILGIKSKTTLQKLRDDPKSKIKFSQSNRIIKYFKQSLYDYLERNVVE